MGMQWWLILVIREKRDLDNLSAGLDRSYLRRIHLWTLYWIPIAKLQSQRKSLSLRIIKVSVHSPVTRRLWARSRLALTHLVYRLVPQYRDEKYPLIH
jgi:hypothetical protein